MSFESLYFNKCHSPPLHGLSWNISNPLAWYIPRHRKFDLFSQYVIASSLCFNTVLLARELTNFFTTERVSCKRTSVLNYILTFEVMTCQLYTSPVTYINFGHAINNGLHKPWRLFHVENWTIFPKLLMNNGPNWRVAWYCGRQVNARRCRC